MTPEELKERDALIANPKTGQMTAQLKEIMDQSPDPHLPEERDRISIELSDRALPHLSSVIKADDDQAFRPQPKAGPRARSPPGSHEAARDIGATS